MCIGVNLSIGIDFSAFIAMIDLATVVSAPFVYADDVRCKHSPNGNFCDCDYAEYCCCQFYFA